MSSTGGVTSEHVGFDCDDEEMETIESETQQDRDFIVDDDDEVYEDRSFYRRLHQEGKKEKQSPTSSSGVMSTLCDDFDDFDDEGDESDMEEEKGDIYQPRKKRLTRAEKLCQELDNHIKELPVVGFNSGKYDINVLKQDLIPTLVDLQGIDLTIKRNNAYLALNSGMLKFLDITNFLAAGTSYDAFLKAYQCQGEKGFFPYEYLDGLERLEEEQLPPREAFNSWLKNSEFSQEDYAYCQRVWIEKGMKSMKDFLVWYNNLDVVPFLEALEKMCVFWQEQGIDMLKEAISLPGLAFKFEMGFLKQQEIYLSSFKTKDSYDLFHNNLVGGLAIIFKRHAEVDKTYVRNNTEKPVKKIIGYDANGLYLWALCQPMPTDLCVEWKMNRRGESLTAKLPWSLADEWLAWESHHLGRVLRTRLNDKEKRLGDRQVAVDGWNEVTKTPYEFMGCYWHGCRSCFEQERIHPTRGKTFGYWRTETERKIDYLKSLGYSPKVKWECVWKADRWSSTPVSDCLNAVFPLRKERWKRKLPHQLLKEVTEETCFGYVEVDIRVPEHLKEKFAEMPPIFKNTDISLDDIGPHMREFAKRNKIMTRPRRSLIGSFFGEKILLSTPLLKFYLEEGLEVTKVYQAFQWLPKSCFAGFGDFVSHARRQADADKSQKILGETAKTVGNAGYGRFLMDVSKHHHIEYTNDSGLVAKTINSWWFKDLDELSDGVFELETAKKEIKMELPIQIGFFVYQYAKLKMLEFYYRFIDHFIDRQDYEYLEMDTDSAYMSLAGDSIDDLVKEEKKEEFIRCKHQWFPRNDTSENAAYDKRTPGLFHLCPGLNALTKNTKNP